MSHLAALFISNSHRFLTDDYAPKIGVCLQQLTADDVWWRPNETSNSIGNLLLHLNGNMSQWILSGVGGRPYARERQREFDERQHLPPGELFGRLEATVAASVEIIDAQTEASLVEHRQIQGYDVTVLEAIYHVVEHFGMHTGQIITIAKLRAASDLKLWQPPAP